MKSGGTAVSREKGKEITLKALQVSSEVCSAMARGPRESHQCEIGVEQSEKQQESKQQGSTACGETAQDTKNRRVQGPIWLLIQNKTSHGQSKSKEKHHDPAPWNLRKPQQDGFGFLCHTAIHDGGNGEQQSTTHSASTD